MTLRTFSSILPFTRRFGVRGVTCMTNGALGGNRIAESKSELPKTPLPSVLPQTPPPPVLFKYAGPNLKRISQVIRDGKVYFSSPLGLNDPFDCRSFADVTTLENRKEIIRHGNEAYERMKARGLDMSGMLQGEESEKHQQRILEDPEYAARVINEDLNERFFQHINVGVCCLTEKNDNTLMWTHYAKNLTGVCFEFNMGGHWARAEAEAGGRWFPFELISQVQYKDKLPDWKWGEGEDFWTGPFFTKAKKWEYEQEWRSIMFDAAAPVGGTNEPSLPECIGIWKGAEEYPLDDGLLSGVILGCHVEDKLKQRVVKMAKDRGIKIQQVFIDNLTRSLKVKPYSESRR